MRVYIPTYTMLYNQGFHSGTVMRKKRFGGWKPWVKGEDYTPPIVNESYYVQLADGIVRQFDARQCTVIRDGTEWVEKPVFK